MISHRWFLYLVGAGSLAAGVVASGVKAPHAAARTVPGQPVGVHTPPGMGYLCTWPGDSAFHDDFFTFSARGSTLSGQVSEADISALATVPMTGIVHGNQLTILPLSGFGRFQGSISGSALSLTAANGDSGNVAINCSLVEDAKWRQTIPKMGFEEPPQRPADTIAVYDLEMVGFHAEAAAWAGTTLAFGHVAWRIRTTSGSVSAAHDVSLTKIGHTDFRVEATRSATGRCWYRMDNDGSSASNGGLKGLVAVPPGTSHLYASPPGVQEASCSSSPVGTPLQSQQ